MSLESKVKVGKRVAFASIGVSGALAIIKITVGLIAHSASVVADGVESAGDVVASGFVFLGFQIAGKPADKNHPYGHGRYETLTGLVVGIILFLGGIGVCFRSLESISLKHPIPGAYAMWPLLLSMLAKAVLSTVKFRFGRRIGSSALVADAWNDFVDILSAITAMTALGLTLLDPVRFESADHYGGFAVGLIVIFTGLRVAKESSERLTDTMPTEDHLRSIRTTALSVAGVNAVEKCFARSSGLQYHVDLHIEVDPEMSVRSSHDIANEVRFTIRRRLDWVADVLVHVEPSPDAPRAAAQIAQGPFPTSR